MEGMTVILLVAVQQLGQGSDEASWRFHRTVIGAVIDDVAVMEGMAVMWDGDKG